MATQLTNYQCPACTGPLHFDGASGKLVCDFCGSSYDTAEIEALYASLLTSGTLHRHLAEIDQACNERMAIIVSDMARQEDVTEALKAADQMEWVRRMNSIRNRAEEIVLTELVYE